MASWNADKSVKQWVKVADPNDTGFTNAVHADARPEDAMKANRGRPMAHYAKSGMSTLFIFWLAFVVGVTFISGKEGVLPFWGIIPISVRAKYFPHLLRRSEVQALQVAAAATSADEADPAPQTPTSTSAPVEVGTERGSDGSAGKGWWGTLKGYVGL